jgi:hypothetical protein
VADLFKSDLSKRFSENNFKFLFFRSLNCGRKLKVEGAVSGFGKEWIG